MNQSVPPSPSAEPISDEDLMAYADGQLEPATAQRIERALADDPPLQRRLAAFQASRRILSESFSQTLREPVPRALLALLAEPEPAAERRSEGPSLGPTRRRRVFRSGWVPMALAASLALAIGLSLDEWNRPGPAKPSMIPAVAALGDPDLIAQALENQPTGNPLGRTIQGEFHEVLALVSFVSEEGRLCREFDSTVVSGQPRTTRAIACRGDAGWGVTHVATAPVKASPEADSYRPASGDHRIEDVVARGRRLPADAERELIERGWSTP